jgi:hypothetical protein
MRAALLVIVLAAAPRAVAPQAAPDTVAQRLAAVASDTGEQLGSRAAALHALRGRCEPGTFATLTRLGEPYRQPWVVWHGALAVLAECADPELAGLWRGLLAFPRRPVREFAVVGLARSGSRYDREVLRQATRRETEPQLRQLSAWADSLLALPFDQRRGIPVP